MSNWRFQSLSVVYPQLLPLPAELPRATATWLANKVWYGSRRRPYTWSVHRFAIPLPLLDISRDERDDRSCTDNLRLFAGVYNNNIPYSAKFSKCTIFADWRFQKFSRTMEPR